MNLEAVAIMELSAGKSDFPGFSKLIISRLRHYQAGKQIGFSCNFCILKIAFKAESQQNVYRQILIWERYL